MRSMFLLSHASLAMGSLVGIDLYSTMSILGYGLRPELMRSFGCSAVDDRGCVFVFSDKIRLIPIVFLAIFGIIVSLKWEAELSCIQHASDSLWFSWF